MTSTKNHLNATRIVDKNGKKTTVYKKTAGKSWAGGSNPPSRASRAVVVSSAPTPATGLSGLKALVAEKPDRVQVGAHLAHLEGIKQRADRDPHFWNTAVGVKSRGATDVHFLDRVGVRWMWRAKTWKLSPEAHEAWTTRKARWTTHGFDEEGYDREGWSHDNRHFYTGTRIDAGGFDREGFDIDGYDRDGKNRDGLNREQAAIAAEHGIDADLVLAMDNGGDSE